MKTATLVNAFTNVAAKEKGKSEELKPEQAQMLQEWVGGENEVKAQDREVIIMEILWKGKKG